MASVAARLHFRVIVSASSAAEDGKGKPNNAALAKGSTRAPLIDALQARGDRRAEASFHVPGHKRGSGAPARLVQLIGSDVLRHDLTELEGLDFLAYPDGPIREAQELAAATFGADATWFLVNGTTVGIQAAVLSTCMPGDHLILSRNCHQSAYSAMVLSGVSPIYVDSPICGECGVAATMTPPDLSAALKQAYAAGQRVCAVLVVSPTYFGVCADVESLAAIAHSYGVPLLVDEAHGAHLSMHPRLPRGAMQQRADVAIQSTHKVLASMTQSSMLHAQGDLVCHAKLSAALQTLQSSSPSYILMASLDAARLQASEAAGLEEAVGAAEAVRAGMSTLTGIRLLEALDPSHLRHSAGIDPWRFTCDVQPLGITGFEAARRLEEEHGVVAELSTQQVVVFAFGIGSTHDHGRRLLTALRSLDDDRLTSTEREQGGRSAATPRMMADRYSGLGNPEVVMSPRDAFFRPKQRVSVREAVGRVCGELLCPYPPGIAVLLPGERITAAGLQVLMDVQRQGGRIAGASDEELATVLCVCE